MRVLFVLTVLAALTGTAHADTQRLSTWSPDFPEATAIAVGAGGTVAVAYRAPKGLRLRIARGGRRFSRPHVVAGRRHRTASEITLDIAGDGRVLVAWARNDGSDPADPYSRDEDCCDRIHAALLGASGRRRAGPRRLSPARVHASLAGVELARGFVAIGWQGGHEYGNWVVRSGRSLARLGPARSALRRFSVLTGALGSSPSGRLLAVTGSLPHAQRTTRVEMRAALPGRRFRRLGRPATAATGAFQARFVIDVLGRAIGMLDSLGRTRLVRTDRAGNVRIRRGGERTVFAASPSGAAIAVDVAFRGRRARARLLPSSGGFGRARPFRLAPRPVMFWDVLAAVGPDDDGAVFAAERPQGRTHLYMTPVADGRPSRRRRLRSFNASADLLGAAVDGRGRPIAIIRQGRRLDAVWP